MKYVLDASFVGSLFLPDEESEESAKFISRVGPEDCVAPGLLLIEITNLLLMARRRNRLSGIQLKSLSSAFDVFPVSIQPNLSNEQRESVLQLAEKHSISAYDAVYLELCIRSNLKLATLDTALKAGAKVEGVELVI